MAEKRTKNTALAALIKQHPEFSQKIEDLMKGNPDFKQMCEDYLEVTERLEFWIRQAEISNDQIKKQITENLELLEELKQEILLALKQEDC